MSKSSVQPMRVMTRHPAGKNGVNISRDKYDDMRHALLRVIPRTRAGVAFRDLARLVRPLLDSAIFAPKKSVNWYVVTVKQDLEAEGAIERISGAQPQHLRRSKATAR